MEDQKDVWVDTLRGIEHRLSDESERSDSDVDEALRALEGARDAILMDSEFLMIQHGLKSARSERVLARMTAIISAGAPVAKALKVDWVVWEEWELREVRG